MSSRPVWTIGHSSRSSATFLELLRGARIEVVADVRRYPGSRTHPQFNVPALSQALRAQGMRYHPMPELGGRRPPRPDSVHTIWRNDSFRGYADYMDSSEFENALEDLILRSRDENTALLCSEALWWRCHRALIADALKVRGISVLHIMAEGKIVEHPYTSAATIVDNKLVYGAAR